MKTTRHRQLPFLAVALIATITSAAHAQLQITEVMFDSASAEPRWEWFELRNTGGAAIDLNGAYVRDMAGNDILAPNIDNTMTANTVVPAEGVAVVFNASGQDHTVFRQAWNLGAGVPLIGVSSDWSSLNNGGDHFGIWANGTDYAADLGDGDADGDLEIVQFNNALVNLNYNGFPDGGAGVSSYWTGTGSITDGTQWATSVVDTDGAYQSSRVATQSNINSTDDIGNPGVIPGGSIAAGLVISEIMYNPRSTNAESNWEWIEVVNNTGAAIDFASGGYFLDDAANGGLSEPNISEGSIPDGGIAILYNSATPEGNITGAWGAGLNVIPVSSWSSLNNSNNGDTGIADTIGIWANAADYATDSTNGDFANATTSQSYQNNTNDWPNDDGNGSIYLSDLSADSSLGSSWLLSAPEDLIGSFNAMGVGGEVVEHEGTDIGSPGVFGSTQPTGGDFNGDGNYDCADIDALVGEVAGGTNTGSFDLTGDGLVNLDDVNAWLLEAGEANIGPERAYLAGDANLDGSVDVGDFNIWNTSKFTATAEWCSGDFNADGAVDVGDFNIWNTNKFTASDVQGVPEPGSWLLLVAGLPLLMRYRR